MAGGKSEYLEKALLDHVMGGPDYVRPATVYIALCTGVWDDALTGATIVEPVVGSYARVASTNDATNWPGALRPDASGALKANGVDLLFPTPTAAWGTVKSVAVCDAATGGNVLWGGDLVVPKAVASGNVIAFATATLAWKED